MGCCHGDGMGVIVATGTRGRGRGELWGVMPVGLFQPLGTCLTEMLAQLKQVQGL